MSAFSVVRFRVKSGREQQFLAAFRNAGEMQGGVRATVIKTGERSYCVIGEFTDMDALAGARPRMIASLDSIRDALEDLGGGLGVTDPVSGPVVLDRK